MSTVIGPLLSTPTDPSTPHVRMSVCTPGPTPLTSASPFEIFLQSARIHSDARMLGWRSGGAEGGGYQWVSYGEVERVVRRLGAGMQALLGIRERERVGIYGKNCAAWVGCEMALNALGGVLVPLYDSVGAGSVRFIVEEAELKVVFVEQRVLGRLLQVLEGGRTGVEKVVVFGGQGFEVGQEVRAEVGKQASSCGNFRLMVLDDLLSERELGETKTLLDNLYCVMYTSGTTSVPKGVMLTNGALVRSVESGQAFFTYWKRPLDRTDVYISYLPLAHIYEQANQLNVFLVGGAVGFFRGNPKLLSDDMMELKPTLFPGVPRVFSRFQRKIEDVVEKSGWLFRTLFNFAYNIQLANVQNLRPRNALLDVLVFNKFRDRILPRAKLVLTSAAPMSSEMNDYLKVVLNAPVVQGYGLTESCGPILCSAPDNSVSGTCGGPLPYCKVKLVDVPEMDYLTSDKPCPRGEMYVHSPMLMLGYYKRDDETARSFPDGDGWLATGDIARWREDGAIEIIDRKKNLFKLAQGEYIAPEALEGRYGRCRSISQIWVYGNSFEAKLVAIIVPSMNFAKQWAAENGQVFESLAQIAGKEEFKATVLAQLEEMRKEAGFKGYERIGDIRFETDVTDTGQGFTVEKDLVTPTFKLKRPQLKAKYMPLLNEMYGKN